MTPDAAHVPLGQFIFRQNGEETGGGSAFGVGAGGNFGPEFVEAGQPEHGQHAGQSVNVDLADGQGRRSCCASLKTALNRRSARRNGQQIIKTTATIGQLKVADALQAEPAMPLPRKQSKIEVPQKGSHHQLGGSNT
jgi:hypothetical protein